MGMRFSVLIICWKMINDYIKLLFSQTEYDFMVYFLESSRRTSFPKCIISSWKNMTVLVSIAR